MPSSDVRAITADEVYDSLQADHKKNRWQGSVHPRTKNEIVELILYGIAKETVDNPSWQDIAHAKLGVNIASIKRALDELVTENRVRSVTIESAEKDGLHRYNLRNKATYYVTDVEFAQASQRKSINDRNAQRSGFMDESKAAILSGHRDEVLKLYEQLCTAAGLTTESEELPK